MDGNTANEIQELEMVIERVFDAPRELVWKMWTEAETDGGMVGAGNLHDTGL